MNKLNLLLALLAILTLCLAQEPQCWYPDGVTPADGHTPCDPSSPASGCCPDDGYCLASGLCARRGMLIRGSCSDQGWESDDCPKFCLDAPTSITQLQSCSNGEDESYMCMEGGSCDPASRLTIEGNDEIRLRPSQLEAVLGDSSGDTTCPEGSPSESDDDKGDAASTEEPVTILNVWQTAVLGASIGGILLLIVAMLSVLLWREKRARIMLENERVFVGPPPMSAHFSPRGFIIERRNRQTIIDQQQNRGVAM